MRIAYMTIDEVNQDLAVVFADHCGATLCVLWPQENPQPGEFDSLLYDLDCLPRAQRDRLVAELLSAPLSCPVALHSYGLDEEQADTLGRHGVVVYRRLEMDLFRGKNKVRETLRARGRAVRPWRSGRQLCSISNRVVVPLPSTSLGG